MNNSGLYLNLPSWQGPKDEPGGLIGSFNPLSNVAVLNKLPFPAPHIIWLFKISQFIFTLYVRLSCMYV